jgi:hypothetical protein
MLAKSISRGQGGTTIMRVKCEGVMTAMIEFDLLMLGKRFTRQISQMWGRSAVLRTHLLRIWRQSYTTRRVKCLCVFLCSNLRIFRRDIVELKHLLKFAIAASLSFDGALPT